MLSRSSVVCAILLGITGSSAFASSATQVVNTVPAGHSARNYGLLEQLRQDLSVDVVLQDLGNYHSAATKERSEEQAQQVRKELESKTMYMTDVTGQAFECKMDQDGTQKRRATKIPAPSEVSAESVHEVLKQLEGACFTLRKGYWNYEWCHNSMIRQFHMENGVATTDWSLGTFSPDLNSLGSLRSFPSTNSQSVPNPEAPSAIDSADAQSVNLSDPPKLVNSRPTYFSQRFEGGQHCDEINKPRKSEVRFYCCPQLGDTVLPIAGMKHPVSLQQIEEISVCTYTVSVCSPLACEAGILAPDAVDAWGAIRGLVGKCFHRHMEWWSYEFCFEQHIRQFHMSTIKNKEGKRVQYVADDFLLGKFDPNGDTGKLDVLQGIARDPEAKLPLYLDEGPEPAIVQVYIGGVSDRAFYCVGSAIQVNTNLTSEKSPCEMTGEQRQTFVRFGKYLHAVAVYYSGPFTYDTSGFFDAVCKSPDKQAAIVSIEEVATCKYNIVFHTPLVCKHRLFRKEARVTDRLTCRKRTSDSKADQTTQSSDLSQDEQQPETAETPLL